KEKEIPINKDKIEGVLGEEKFEGLVLEDGTEEMKALMIAEGTSGSLDFARSLGIRIEDDRLVVDDDQYTQLPRVYAAGDCTGGARQIGAAVGEGSEAAINLINELRDTEYLDWKH
ncbi:MAG: FAD-dependent oxidoreductase, partial [Candidatus Saliniplasma sp.]